MSSLNVDNILGNCEILIRVFESLPFIDQLRLSQVNVLMKNIFQTFVWKESYRTLVIHKNGPDFVVTNETGINRLCLTADEFSEFMAVYAADVEELKAHRISPLRDLTQFPNLNSLTFIDMTMPKSYLDMLGESCPNLQHLNLCCFCQEDRRFLQIGQNLEVNTLLKMKNLKSLTLQNDEYLAMKFKDLWNILNAMKVETLRLKVQIDPEQESDEQLYFSDLNVPHLRKLEIQSSFDPHAWPKNFPNYLKIFQNLQSLRLKISEIVTDDILETIARNSAQLVEFHIDYTVFKNIRLFSLAPKVTEFSLHYCRGLTFSNIKQLLSRTGLEKFCCRNTDYGGDFEDFKISPTIKSLDLDGVATNKIPSAYENNTNLKEITWYHTLYNDDREIVRNIPLASCTNLVTLNMREGLMASEILLQMKSLRQLTMIHPAPFLGWSYILALLQQSFLSELTIGKPTLAELSRIPSNISAENYSTKLQLIKIPLDIFEAALEFWLDLFNRNPTMTLICCPFEPSKLEFLKQLATAENFPRDLNKISICCFSVGK